jgi:hypothetical protein
LIGAEVEGGTISEVVPVEGAMLETEVATGAATEPAEIAPPRWLKRCMAMPCRR